MFKVLDIAIDPKINSEFVGYQEQTAKGSCVALFDEEGNSVTSLSGEGFAIFSKTPFYAESGGQVADIGIFKNTNLNGEILNCKKVGDFHLHEVTIAKGSLELNADVELIIAAERREKIVSNHSATHLLHSALRKVLGESVEQRGSLVNEEKLRFDFSHSNKVTDCLLYTSPSPRDRIRSRMPSSA